MLKQFIPLALLAGVFSLAAVACGGDEVSPATPTPTQLPSPPPPPPPPVATATLATDQGSATGDDKEVDTKITVINRDIAGPTKEYKFDPKDFEFKVGETVEFIMVAETEYHTFTVAELDIDFDVDGSETPGAKRTFVYTFDKAGEFKLVCVVHELEGMIGTITVR